MKGFHKFAPYMCIVHEKFGIIHSVSLGWTEHCRSFNYVFVFFSVRFVSSRTSRTERIQNNRAGIDSSKNSQRAMMFKCERSVAICYVQIFSLLIYILPHARKIIFISLNYRLWHLKRNDQTCFVFLFCSLSSPPLKNQCKNDSALNIPHLLSRLILRNSVCMKKQISRILRSFLFVFSNWTFKL